MHRSHEDDRSAFLLVHMRNTRLRRQECAVEMDGEQFFPVRKRKIFDRMNDLDTSVRDEHVDGPPFTDDLFDAGIDLILVTDIHRHGHRRIGMIRIDRIGSGLRGVQPQIGDGDAAAGFGVAFGDSFADAAGGSGDDGNPVVQFHPNEPFPGR